MNVPGLLQRRNILSTPIIAAAIQYWIDSDSPLRGRAIHSLLIKSCNRPNTNISIKLLVLYLKCKSLSYARQMFDEMPNKTLSPYNYLISAYSKQNSHSKSLLLIRELIFNGERPDQFTLSMILKTSAAVKSLKLCMEAHSQVIRVFGGEEDEVLLTALIDSYAKNDSLNYARKVFDGCSLRGNVVCSTAMISGYMRRGLVKEAETIFAASDAKDVVAFNAMIEGYSSNPAIAVRSIHLFIAMQTSGLRPTISTFASLIGACAALCEAELGRQIHGRLAKMKIFRHVRSGSAIVDMYAKCGRVEDSRKVFDEMPERNVFTWSSMIDGYGKNGMAQEALALLRKMLKDGDVVPNDVTFLAALSACGHGGLVSEGKKILDCMERDYSLKPNVEHFACMVDLLGRSGELREALAFIRKMPCRPNCDVWAALLGACRLHGEVELAAVAAGEIFELNRKERPGAYVALSNTFAAAGEWGSVGRVREMMKARGVSKGTANSWTCASVS